MKHITVEHITLETICSHTCQHRSQRCRSYTEPESIHPNTAVISNQRPVPQLTAPPHWDEREAWQHWQRQHATEVDHVMQTQGSCTVFVIVSQKNVETEATGTESICRLTGGFIFQAWGAMFHTATRALHLYVYSYAFEDCRNSTLCYSPDSPLYWFILPFVMYYIF